MATAAKKLDSVERFLRLAKSAGLPRDSVERFLKAGYVPQPKQILFHSACRKADSISEPSEIGFGGARGPGKTTASFAQVAIDDCQRVENLKCLFLRKVAKAARESMIDLRMKLLRFVPHDYNQGSGLVKYPNGSRIVLGHFNHDKDIDAYLGLEYDLIAIEEDTQLSARKKRDIATCLRTSKVDWRPRRYRTTNPGGIDHGGFKREFIVPFRANKETSTRFIPATVYDNVFVNSEYKQTLEKLIGWQRAAWLEGDWDIAAGQFFTNWRHASHVCKPFRIPSHWRVWAAMDYGFTHPTSVHLFTEYDGVTYVIAEYVAAKRLPSQHAPEIIKLFKDQGVDIERVRRFVAGVDVFANKGDEKGKTIAAQYKEHGIELKAANMDRINGAARILTLLGDPAKKVKPKLRIFNTCTKLIETLPAMQHDPNRPEDVLKVDVDDDGSGGDDPYDDLRYGLMTKIQKFGVEDFTR